MLANYKKILLACSLIFFLSATALYFLHASDSPSQEEFTAHITSNMQEEALELQREVVPILENLEQSNELLFSSIPNPSHPFYVYKNGRLVYWSDYRFVPEYRYLAGDYTYKFVKSLRKEYLVRKWSVDETDYEVYGAIMLHSTYKIDNNYVHSGYNPSIFSSQSLKLFSTDMTVGQPVCLDSDNCVFRVLYGENYTEAQTQVNYIIAGLYAFSIVLLLGYCISFFYSEKPNLFRFSLLVMILVGIRAVMLLLDFPNGLVDVGLFDSRYFASSSLNPSFGDLLINLVFVLIISLYYFLNNDKMVPQYWLDKLNVQSRFIMLVLISGMMLLVFHFQYLVFQTIYHNSQVSFDVNRGLEVDGHRWVTLIIFVLGSTITFLLFHIGYKWLFVLSGKRRRILLAFGLSSLLFILVNFFIGQVYIYSFIVATSLFIVLLLSGLPDYVIKLSYNTFLYCFTFLIASAVIGALSIDHFENEQEREKKLKFANQFLIENDNLAEYLLSEVNQNIKQDLFIQGRMSSPFFSKDVIKSKIKQVYLGSYFDKYEIKIYLYNANGKSFDNTDNQLSPEEINEFDVAEYKTNYDGIYFINRLGINASKRYLDFIEIKRRGVLMGYVIMDLNLKRIIPENVYPELLVDNRFLTPYQNANYSYAVYSQGVITYHSGDYNYITDFDKELLSESELFAGALSQGGYLHLAVKDNQGRIIVIISNNHPLSDLFSNFSFLFLTQVFVFLIVVACFALYYSFQKVTLNYSARIQLYLNAAFFLPLIAVSITTLSVINSSFRKEVNEEYFKKAESISTNLSDPLKSFIQQNTTDHDELRSKIAEVAKYAGVDVNLFSTRGRLLASSQPLIYENDLLSQYINPRALGKIREQGENAYVTTEAVGNLDFYSTFYAVKSFESGQLIGILSIPFFQSEYTIQQNQVEVLTTVTNIFSVIFLFFLLVSYLAAKWLTFPLVLITQKLKKTTLTGFNEPLTWKADDEIGLMVSEYNRMLLNLEDSKKALARTEKESAWREIAQQVAHEIKNPLTPMKLTLQHLRRRIQGAAQDGDFEKPIDSLLVQVDTLNDIASSFSSFAKMPIPENEVYELGAVVKNTVSLLENTEFTEIFLELPADPVFTRGDEQLMGRIISNIIINAIQAREKDSLTVHVNLTILNKQKLLLEMRDNGPGIDESIHNKIFIPNFSTKETGSGIGLAIAKHGVEHAGGKIWFETEQGSGTSFFIELPIVPNEG